MRLVRRRQKAQIVEPNRFIDLGTMEDEQNGAGEARIKVAEMNCRDDVSIVSDQVYKGNIVVVDYSPMADDQEEVAAVANELKAVARDCNGDVVSVGRTFIVIAPNGIRIDRHRLKG